MESYRLSHEEITQITGYTRYQEQKRTLNCLGVPFTQGRKKEPIVLRRNMHAVPTVPQTSTVDTETPVLPNFGAFEDHGKAKKRSG